MREGRYESVRTRDRETQRQRNRETERDQDSSMLAPAAVAALVAVAQADKQSLGGWWSALLLREREFGSCWTTDLDDRLETALECQ